jgi:RimJ/RimL family protein N-acetyltransferase
MSETEELLEWSPARRPTREPLQGATVRLEPIDPARHQISLWVAAGEPEIWTYMPYGPWADEEALATWLASIAKSDDPLFYAVVDLRDGHAGGVASYLRITPEHGVIEIGHIWFGLGLQRTRPATEAIYLLARHAFDDLGYRRFEWKCNAANGASRRAAERFGFSFEGVFRQHQIVKGQNRDTAWYAILDHEWPAIRKSFETWLADANFDEDGRQRRRLEDIRKIGH